MAYLSRINSSLPSGETQPPRRSANSGHFVSKVKSSMAPLTLQLVWKPTTVYALVQEWNIFYCILTPFFPCISQAGLQLQHTKGQLLCRKRMPPLLTYQMIRVIALQILVSLECTGTIPRKSSWRSQRQFV